MADGLLLADGGVEAGPRRYTPDLIRVDRRGPILRPSPRNEGVFGIDLTAGCPHGCRFCYIRGLSRYPGEGRVLFDPHVARRLVPELDALAEPPRQVVLSPASDPLPPVRAVVRATFAVARTLLEREVPTYLMTRGRLPRTLIDLLAAHPERAKVAIGLTTLDPALSRALEPRAASPRARLTSVARLIAAGVPVDVRLEPLITDLTDTPENLLPLFDRLGKVGVRRVLAHYLFLHLAMKEPMREALAPMGLAERLEDRFEGGPVFDVGSLGPAKHLPREARQVGLARLSAWGARSGLVVETGASQNPDLPLKAPRRG